MLKRNAALTLILLCYLLLGVLYNFTVPIGEGPDEPGHFRYVLFLATAGRLPMQADDGQASDVPGEGHQPPLAYALATPTVAWLPAEARALEMSANGRFVWAGGDEPGAFHRGSREYWPFSPQIRAWHMARGFSLLCGLITIVCTYLAAQALVAHLDTHSGNRFQDSEVSLNGSAYGDTVPVLAAGLVAFNPQFLFTSALVSNDALVTALSAALLCLALRQESEFSIQYSEVPNLKRWSPTLRFTTLGLVFGLALLTKQSALLLGPLLLWAAWWASGGRFVAFGQFSLIWGCTALAIAGWWYVRNWQLYGDLFGLEVFQAEFSTQAFDWRSTEAWMDGFVQLFASCWAHFGWMSLPAPGWTIGVYGVMCGLALLGLMRLATDQWRLTTTASGVSSAIHSPLCGVVLPIALALLWVVAFALTVGLVAWQGRLLFPALASIAVALALGLQELSRFFWSAQRAVEQRNKGTREQESRAPGAAAQQWTMALVALALLGALALAMPFLVIQPAYTWHTVPERVALASIETPLEARFARSWERGMELRGWSGDSQTALGKPYELTLTWHALEKIPKDWTVFVHLVAADETIVAKSDRKPLNGEFGFTQWIGGDWVIDRIRLDVPADLAPDRYELRVGLFDAKRGDRHTIRDKQGEQIGDYVVIGTIELVSPR
jgi:hypothetical protein